MKPITSGLDQPFTLTTEGQKSQAALQAEVDKFNRDNAELDSATESLRNVDAGAWGASDEAAVSRVKQRQAEMLGREISIRTKIVDFLSVVIGGGELRAAMDRTSQELEKSRAEVGKQLTKIGYQLDGQRHDLVAYHPGVKSARMEFESLQRYSGHHEHRNLHTQAIDLANERLAKHKQAALASI